MDNFTGKVVLITGASRGIGRGTSIEFAKRGAKLSLTGRDAAMLDETVALCEQAGAARDDILLAIGDLKDIAFIQKLVDDTVKNFAHIDVIVNNAGATVCGPMESTSVEEFDELYKVNLRAPFYLTKLAIPHLKKSKGAVVNVSAVWPIIEYAAELVTKGALSVFSKSLSIELAPHGVRVNAISPGYTDTGVFENEGIVKEGEMEKFRQEAGSMHPLGRMATVQDIAQAIVFLASSAASFITGVDLRVDGGLQNTMTTLPSQP